MDLVAKMIDDCFLGSWTLNELLWMNAVQWQLHRRNTKNLYLHSIHSVPFKTFTAWIAPLAAAGVRMNLEILFLILKNTASVVCDSSTGRGRGRGRDGGGDTVARGDPRILYITSTGWFDNILTFQSSTQNLVCFLLRNWKNYNTMRWETK